MSLFQIFIKYCKGWKSDVIMAVNIKNKVLLVVMPCALVDRYQHLSSTCSSTLQVTVKLEAVDTVLSNRSMVCLTN